MSDVLLIEGCNFENYPIGGQLTFAQQMMKAFGNRMALVGISTDDIPIGKWIEKEIDGIKYDFFAYAHRKPSSKKPLIPARITSYMNLKPYRKEIIGKGIPYVFVRAPESLASIIDWGFREICYYFPGVENTLSISKYSLAKPLAGLFDKWFLPKVAKADRILAAADDEAIDQLVKRSKGHIQRDQIIKMPTRIDTDIFHSGDKETARSRLDLELDKLVLVTTGRLHWVKGWKLILRSFERFSHKHRDSILCFVGDGADRPKLEAEVSSLNLEDRVIITGFQTPDIVSDYLRASDLFVMGSEKEGWSTSMVEALATSLPIISTRVSSAYSIIKEGINGYVVNSRDPEEFCAYITKGLYLKRDIIDRFSTEEVKKYALKDLARDIGRVWKPLAIVE